MEVQTQGVGRVRSFLLAQTESLFPASLLASGGCWLPLTLLGQDTQHWNLSHCCNMAFCLSGLCLFFIIG